MHSGLEKKYIQGHLFAFSAAAPIVAITTYFILHAVRKHTSPSLCPSKRRHIICQWLYAFSWWFGSIWIVAFCVCSLVIHPRASSVPQAWECSSQPGLSSMWPQCTFSLKSAAAGRANPPLTPSSTLEPRAASSDTWGSWRASLLSSGLESRWCWPLGFMMTEEEREHDATTPQSLSQASYCLRLKRAPLCMKNLIANILSCLDWVSILRLTKKVVISCLNSISFLRPFHHGWEKC